MGRKSTDYCLLSYACRTKHYIHSEKKAKFLRNAVAKVFILTETEIQRIDSLSKTELPSASQNELILLFLNQANMVKVKYIFIEVL